jgi:hypothetical protein
MPVASRTVTIDGVTLTVAEWLKRTGITRQGLWLRRKAGMSEAEALTVPPKSNQPIDITGQTFGRMVALRLASPDRRGNRRWMCVCECGAQRIANQSNLRSGKTRSCGCLNHEPRNVTHGHASDKHGRSSEYWTWWNTRAKCSRPSASGWESHGAKGVRVCSRWARFEDFLADMGPIPGPEFTLVRKDPDGDFTPSNCRWGVTEYSSKHGKMRRRRKVRACG